MLAEIYETYKEFREATGRIPAKLILSRDFMPDILSTDYVLALLNGGKIEAKDFAGVPIEWVEGENVCYFSL